MQSLAGNERPLILYIEDEPDLCEDVADELKEAGYSVVLACDGEQALQCLAALRPDLILCDITMPRMSGYELLQALRQTRPDLADIPFVFLTAQTDPRQVVDGKRAGADDYLIKPVDFDLMLATIQARLTQIARIRQAHDVQVQEAMQAALGTLYQGSSRDVTGPVARAFDYVSFGIVLLDAHQQVRFANRAAHRMADVVSGLSLDGVFRLGGVRQGEAFRAAFSAALQGAHEAGDVLECLVVPRHDGQRDVLLMICGLGGGPTGSDDTERRSTSHHTIESATVSGDMRADQMPGHDPVVMVIMADPSHRPAVASQALESLFELTPTEAQIANAFAEGKRTEEIAREFNISATTVNFHKRNLFDKTGTNRQADLIALMLSLPAQHTA